MSKYDVIYHDHGGYGYEAYAHKTGGGKNIPITAVIETLFNVEAKNKKQAVLIAKATENWQGYKSPENR